MACMLLILIVPFILLPFRSEESLQESIDARMNHAIAIDEFKTIANKEFKTQVNMVQKYIYATGINPVGIVTYENDISLPLCKAERRQIEGEITIPPVRIAEAQKEDEGKCPKCKVGIMRVYFDETGGATCDKCRNTTRGRY